MLTCPYHKVDVCRYHKPCNIEMAMPEDSVFNAIKKFTMQEWDNCEIKLRGMPGMFVEGEKRGNGFRIRKGGA